MYQREIYPKKSALVISHIYTHTTARPQHGHGARRRQRRAFSVRQSAPEDMTPNQIAAENGTSHAMQRILHRQTQTGILGPGGDG